MDYCFPNPAHPVIPATSGNLKHRRYLRYLMYGQFYVAFVKFLIWGPLSGILQLISVWMVYNAWATMHFCSTLMCVIFVGFDLLIVGMDFSRINAMLSYSPTYQFLFYSMLAYYIIALVVSYRAYRCFKE